MGMKANSGYFYGTKGSVAIGDANLMDKRDNFAKFISKRKDVDDGGYYDVIAHGDEEKIRLNSNGKDYDVNWRLVAKIIKNKKDYKGQPIRLLSCNTGKSDDGFAQNLANKLNVPVKAPIAYVVTTGQGRHYVAEKVNNKYKIIENGYKIFYPKRRQK